MDYCSKFIDATGYDAILSKSKKASLLSDIVSNTFQSSALRTILLAFSDISLTDYERMKASNNGFEKEADREVLESSEMTLICIFGLMDPIRDEIKESVHKC